MKDQLRAMTERNECFPLSASTRKKTVQYPKYWTHICTIKKSEVQDKTEVQAVTTLLYSGGHLTDRFRSSSSRTPGTIQTQQHQAQAKCWPHACLRSSKPCHHESALRLGPNSKTTGAVASRIARKKATSVATRSCDTAATTATTGQRQRESRSASTDSSESQESSSTSSPKCRRRMTKCQNLSHGRPTPKWYARQCKRCLSSSNTDTTSTTSSRTDSRHHPHHRHKHRHRSPSESNSHSSSRSYKAPASAANVGGPTLRNGSVSAIEQCPAAPAPMQTNTTLPPTCSCTFTLRCIGGYMQEDCKG